jgi:protein-disulfide isomerase/uncharacterized membrane protein
MIGTLSSAMLAARHLGGGDLPGCGPKSACTELERTVWGAVPGLAWPTSFVGFAWFTGLLAAWSSIRSALPAFVTVLARGGAAVSVGFLLVMLVMRKLCPYCLLVHLASLCFFVLVERARRTTLRGRATPGNATARAAVAMGIGFGVMSAGLAAVELPRRAARVADARAAAASRAGATAAVVSKEALAGRFRLGPEDASVRIVLFTDFQCRDCRRVEAEIREVMAGGGDVSLTVKHFPMCNACNDAIGAQNLHPNACWAARAAEAAGTLKGDAGFFTMCGWLFERSGAFTDAELRAALPELGFEPAAFVRTMHEGSTEALVKSDIRDAIGLGIRSTPLVFVDGVELRGWEVPGVTRAVLSELVANASGSALEENPRGDRR